MPYIEQLYKKGDIEGLEKELNKTKGVGIYRVIYTLIIDKQIKLVFNDKRV